MRAGAHWQWYLDEVFVKINGKTPLQVMKDWHKLIYIYSRNSHTTVRDATSTLAPSPKFGQAA
jgi:hypothetical protein